MQHYSNENRHSSTYFQIPLEAENSKYTGFQAHIGAFTYCKMPIRSRTASNTCQHFSSSVVMQISTRVQQTVEVVALMPPVVTLWAVTKDDSRLCVCLPCDIASSSVSAWVSHWIRTRFTNTQTYKHKTLQLRSRR